MIRPTLSRKRAGPGPRGPVAAISIRQVGAGRPVRRDRVSHATGACQQPGWLERVIRSHAWLNRSSSSRGRPDRSWYTSGWFSRSV